MNDFQNSLKTVLTKEDEEAIKRLVDQMMKGGRK
jgi:hypothetical protein